MECYSWDISLSHGCGIMHVWFILVSLTLLHGDKGGFIFTLLITHTIAAILGRTLDNRLPEEAFGFGYHSI